MSKDQRAEAIDLDALNLDTARGVMALCDAITYLRRAHKRTNYAGMEKVLNHLTLAAAGIPDEMFAIMFAANHIGTAEVAARLQEVAA